MIDVQVWMRGERGGPEKELQLCAVRRDRNLLQMHTRWYFTFDEHSCWNSIVLLARPLKLIF